MSKSTYPTWVCHDCGIKHGAWYRHGEYIGPKAHSATFHIGDCDCCKKSTLPVTEPRDYGHLPNWEQGPGKPETLEDIAEIVLEEFPFSKVQTAMNSVNWRWAHPDQSLKVPSIDRLKGAAAEYLQRAVEEQRKAGYGCLGSGGFMARADKNGVSLEFVFASSEAEFSDFQ